MCIRVPNNNEALVPENQVASKLPTSSQITRYRHMNNTNGNKCVLGRSVVYACRDVLYHVYNCTCRHVLGRSSGCIYIVHVHVCVGYEGLAYCGKAQWCVYSIPGSSVGRAPAEKCTASRVRRLKNFNAENASLQS